MNPPVLDADWGRMSRDQFVQRSFERLRTFVAEQLYPFSTHYRALLDRHGIRPDSLRAPADLERIPFTTKVDLSPTEEDPGKPVAFVLKPTVAAILEAWPLSRRVGLLMQRVAHGSESLQRALGREYRPALLTFTTGRSAAPVPFAYSLYDLEVLRASGERLIEVLGVDPAKGTGVDLFPYAPHLAFWQTVFAGFASAHLLFHTGGGRVMGTDMILATLRRMRPATLMGIPGYVYHVLRACEAGKIDLSKLERIVLGGDAAPAGLRLKLAEVAGRCGAQGVKVLSVYGFTEARLCWSECPAPEPSGFHLYPDMGYVEIVDPKTGKPVPDGQTGEIVYSTTDGRGTCVLRYRTGDVAEGGIRREPCPHCGRTTPRVGPTLRRVSGMQDLQLTKVRGTLVDLGGLCDRLSGHPALEEWQVVLQKRGDDPFELDELVLFAALREGHNRAVAEAQIQTGMEVKFNRVQWESVAEVSKRLGLEDRLKEQRVLDRRVKPS